MSHVIDVHSHAYLKALEGIQAAIDNFPTATGPSDPCKRRAGRSRPAHDLEHRTSGAAGLEPENTLRAFRRAAYEGAGVLELDLRVTLDGHLVVLHDPTVDRTIDGQGMV